MSIYRIDYCKRDSADRAVSFIPGGNSRNRCDAAANPSGDSANWT